METSEFGTSRFVSRFDSDSSSRVYPCKLLLQKQNSKAQKDSRHHSAFERRMPKRKTTHSSCFKEARVKLLLSLPPQFISSEDAGIERHMSTFLMRFGTLVDGGLMHVDISPNSRELR